MPVACRLSAVGCRLSCCSDGYTDSYADGYTDSYADLTRTLTQDASAASDADVYIDTLTLTPLTSEGVDIEWRSPDVASGGGTALMLAAINGNVNIVKILLAANANANAQNEAGRTALELAKEKGIGEIVALLGQ